MDLTHVRLRSLKHETIGTLLCLAFAVTLLFFYVDTVDAQAIGPQAFRLIGTIQSNNFIGAVFSDSKGEQSFYRVLDTLPDGSKIVAVHSDSISLRGSDGLSYDMYIAHEMKSVTSAEKYAPAEPSASSTMQNINSEQPKPKGRRRLLGSPTSPDEE